MDNKIEKRGQIAIWVIIAILIVVGIVFLIFINRKPVLSDPAESINNPNSYISKCAREFTYEAVDLMLPRGGFIEPENVKLYNGINVTYLCDNIGYYKTCINQHPALLNELKKEIHDYIYPKVDECFNELKRQEEKRNSKVNLGEMYLSVGFAPDRIYIDLNRELKIDKNGEEIKYDKFNVEIKSPLYDLANVANEIASQQAKYCYFEYVGYMILYPRFLINVFSMDDSTRIYTIHDKYSGKEINIAIRGCAIPPGI